MGRSYTAGQFLVHLARSRAWDSFHSPYLFDLFTYCCKEGQPSETFQLIEKQRKKLIQSKDIISRQDYGAGPSSADGLQANQAISSIASNALSRPFQCKFMFRLSSFLHPEHILELGTSFGISAAYLASGAPQARLTTIEGDQSIYNYAQQVIAALKLQNIVAIQSRFEDYLVDANHLTEKIDLLFLDGHHTAKAVHRYYHGLRKRMHKGTVVVVDDIYWSKDMTHGWNHLITLPEITQSVDCFHFGLLFFSNDFLNKQNHIIRLPLKMLLSKH